VPARTGWCVEQATEDDFAYALGPGSARDYLAQTITPGSTFSVLKVTAKMACVSESVGTSLGVTGGPAYVLCEFCSGTPNGSNSVVSSVSVLVSNIFLDDLGFHYDQFTNIDFVFPSTFTIDSGGQYFLRFSTPGFVAVMSAHGNVYAGGTLWGHDFGVWTDQVDDAVFGVYTGTLLTDASFTATDPSDMIREAIDGYQSQGGVVTYNDDSIDDTGLSIDYDFRTATVLEIITKARELAPSNWYWYVDPATQVLYFKELES